MNTTCCHSNQGKVAGLSQAITAPNLLSSIRAPSSMASSILSQLTSTTGAIVQPIMMATSCAVQSASLISKTSVAAATLTPSATGSARGEGGRDLSHESTMYVILLAVSLSLSMSGCWGFHKFLYEPFYFCLRFCISSIHFIDIFLYDERLVPNTT